jgi:hypothetical protein
MMAKLLGFSYSSKRYIGQAGMKRTFEKRCKN